MVDSNLHIDVNNDVIQHSIIYKNIKQEFILTNMDKVELLLIAHHNVIKRKIRLARPIRDIHYFISNISDSGIY